MPENIIDQFLSVFNLKIWRSKISKLKLEIEALALAITHPRTPWYCKLMIALVVGYALSPIDLIPDFIPILGLLDDLILLPMGILVVIRLIPKDVISECRLKAVENPLTLKNNWIAASVIVIIWLGLISWLIFVVWKMISHPSKVN